MNRDTLEKRGFVGWIPLLDAEVFPAFPILPGVYAVSYDAGRPMDWPTTSCGGWHKGRNPTAPTERLEREWVDGADLVYLGKTDRTLAKRLCEFG